jgi:hypothetical protein
VAEVRVAVADLVLVRGSTPIIGIANVKSAILIQNGNQTFLLIVKDARVGPIKDTTYEVELMYEKLDALNLSAEFTFNRTGKRLTAGHIPSLTQKSR